MCASPVTLTPHVMTSGTAPAKFVTASTGLLEMGERTVKVGESLNEGISTYFFHEK